MLRKCTCSRPERRGRSFDDVAHDGHRGASQLSAGVEALFHRKRAGFRVDPYGEFVGSSIDPQLAVIAGHADLSRKNPAITSVKNDSGGAYSE